MNDAVSEKKDLRDLFKGYKGLSKSFLNNSKSTLSALTSI